MFEIKKTLTNDSLIIEGEIVINFVYIKTFVTMMLLCTLMLLFWCAVCLLNDGWALHPLYMLFVCIIFAFAMAYIIVCICDLLSGENSKQEQTS